MSNMYRNGDGEELNYRVIDSNSLMDEKIRQYMEAEARRKSSASGTFVEGLAAESLSYAEGEEGFLGDDTALYGEEGEGGEFDALFADDAEGASSYGEASLDDSESVQLAREEAERIVEAAQNHAEMIISDAKAEVDTLFKNTEKMAQEQGLAEGREAAREELELAKQELENDRLAMQQQMDIERAQMESELVDVILDVFEAVFSIEFSDKKELLLHMISNTLKGIEGAKHFTIKVAPEYMREMEANRSYILEQVGMGIDMTVMADSSLHDSDCVIETENGIFECGPMLQLQNLIKDMKALSFTK